MLNPDSCRVWEGVVSKVKLSENYSGPFYRKWVEFFLADVARMLLVFKDRPLHLKAGLYNLWNW